MPSSQSVCFSMCVELLSLIFLVKGLELTLIRLKKLRVVLEPHLQHISSFLTKLTHKTTKFQWPKACEKNFQELKKD